LAADRIGREDLITVMENDDVAQALSETPHHPLRPAGRLTIDMKTQDPETSHAPHVTRRQMIGAAGLAIATGTLPVDAAATRPGPPSAEGGFASLYPHESRTRSVRDLSGLWGFRLDPHDEGERAGWFNGLDAARRIPVPCSWNDLFDDAADYFGAAWYQTDFQVDPGWHGRRLHLRFGSAVYRAKVWLNGIPLGEHVGGHLPFTFDITAAARFDQPNRLVVMVENRLQLDRVPAVPDATTSHFYQEDYPQTSYDFFPYSGLHRQVWLLATPDVHIRDIVVRTGHDGGTGTVDVEVAVSGAWSGTAHLELTGGPGVVSAVVSIRDGAGHGRLTIAAPRLWSPQDPFLYGLTVRLGGPGQGDEYALKAGIRTIEVRGEQLLLNGKPVQLRGFGKHEDFWLHGRGLDLAVLVRDFELMKWIGANSFRTSHYPYAEEALALADEYGFLVIAETPGVSLTFSDRPEIIESRRRQLRTDIADLIARDKNHPCVILWSMANEPLTKPFHTTDTPPPDAVGKGTQFFADIFAHARALDPTRPVALVSVQGGPPEWVSQGDVVCTNSYNGWYAVSGRLADAADRLRREMTALHERFGAKPVIVTEFGADAMAGVHAQPSEMWSEDYQSDLIAMYLDVLSSLPFVVGTHPWAFADFRTSQSIMRVGSLNLKGVFTRERRPKRAAHTLRELWAGIKSTGWKRQSS
jgi:beta-glucuronidase